MTEVIQVLVHVLPFNHKENYTSEDKACYFTEIMLNIMSHI